MIVDHLLTRSAIRTLALVCAGIAPLANAYFLYMLAYKETPVDTLLSQIPFVLQLLRTNSSSSFETQSLFGASFTDSIHSFYPSLLVNPLPPPSSSSLSSAAFPASTLRLTSPSSSSNGPSSLSPITNVLLTLATYLESITYPEPANFIPGYAHLAAALQPLRLSVLNPTLAFISSHQALAWVASLISLWMATEILFFLHFWTRLGNAQTVDRLVQPPRTRQGREELFKRCMETVEEGEGVRKWVETWFDTGRTEKARLEDVGRSNMMQWLAWAFWAAPLEEVLESPSGMMELNNMVDTLEESKKIKFAEGFNPEVECIRLCLDPVLASHRPLVYYALVWLANTIAGFAFNMLGFTRHSGTVEHVDEFENSKQKEYHPTMVDPETDLSYWYRCPENPKNKVPLVFLHGIGVGLVQYIHFIAALTTISRPIFLIEVPYVSNRLVKVDCMTPDETYFALERILKLHNFPKATFFGHSLGTMLCAAICRASPANSPKSIIAGLILADPICFMTHHSIARNFAYRIPATAAELVMDLFAARELGTSWYIMRRFNWNQCIMFPTAWSRRNVVPRSQMGRLSPILPQKTRVFLSEKDNLLNMTMIAKYLTTKVGLSRDKRDEVVVMPGMDHAQFLLHPSWFMRVLKAAQEC